MIGNGKGQMGFGQKTAQTGKNVTPSAQITILGNTAADPAFSAIIACAFRKIKHFEHIGIISGKFGMSEFAGQIAKDVAVSFCAGKPEQSRWAARLYAARQIERNAKLFA